MTDNPQEPLIRNYFGTFMTAFALIAPLLLIIIMGSEVSLQELCAEILSFNLISVIIWILRSPFFEFWAVVVLSVSLFVPKIFNLELKARALIFLPLILLSLQASSEGLYALNAETQYVLDGKSITSYQETLKILFFLVAFTLGPTISLLSEASSPAALIFQPYMKPIKGLVPY